MSTAGAGHFIFSLHLSGKGDNTAWSVTACVLMTHPCLEPTFENLRQGLKMSGSKVTSGTKMFYVLILKKLSQHLQIG